MSVFKYFCSEKMRCRMARKVAAPPRVESQTAHLRRCRTSAYYLSNIASLLRLASEPFATQRGSRFILLEALNNYFADREPALSS